MSNYLFDPATGEPYNAETFDLDAYLSGIDPEWLASSAGRRALTCDDILLFGVVYLPNLLKNADGEITFSDVHLGLYRDALALRTMPGPEGDRRAYVAPRGSGKSSTLFVITTLWVACHHPTFVAAFSSSNTQAVDHLHAVRKELQTSRLLREDYPSACSPELKNNGMPVADNDSMMLMRNGFSFSARGIDTEVLGLVDPLNRRPQIIYLDDVEGAEGSGYSKYQASQRLKTITDGILPMNDRAHVRLVGTVTIPGGLVHQLIRAATETGEPEQWITDERFTVTYFPPIILREDGTPRSTWPGKWPIAYLLSIQHTRSFKKNMANLPVSEDGEYWSQDDIRYGTLGPLATRWILQVDPALEQKSTNDWTGLTVVAARPASKDWQAWRAKAGPHVDPHTAPLPWPEGLPEWMDPSQSQCEIVHASQVRLAGEPLKAEVLRLLARHQRIKYVRLETNAGGSLWDVVLKGLPVKMLTHKSSVSKEVRFSEALSYWQEGRVIHREKIAVLEDQLTAFPKAQFDDVADSATLAILYFLGASKRVQVGATTVAYT